MNQSRFDDESLMRYADGTAASDEVSAIEAAMQGNASLVRRVGMFRETAALAHAAMNEVLLEPVPQRLVDTVLRAPAAQQAAIDDETLMAYADGALDAVAAARVAARASGDRDTAARIAMFRQTGAMARAAFAPVLDEQEAASVVESTRTDSFWSQVVVPAVSTEPGAGKMLMSPERRTRASSSSRMNRTFGVLWFTRGS